MPPMLDRRRVQKILSKWSAVSRRSAVDKKERKMPLMKANIDRELRPKRVGMGSSKAKRSFGRE